MRQIWERWQAKIQELWGKSTVPQRILLGGVLGSLLLVFVLLLYWLNRPEFEVLYSDLSQEDASQVVEELKEQGVNYKLENQGKTILVPADQVYELRLEVAGEDLMQESGAGLELFQETQIGQTDFVQEVNYQRALQGELSRTISGMPEVQGARVHLVMPEESLFIEERTPATASVMLSLKSGRELDEGQVQGIVNLVSTAVEGLDKENITVADSSGNLLSQPTDGESVQGLTNNQLEYKTKLENVLQQRIERMLGPVIGQGRVMARVNAEVDFSQREIFQENFDPDSQVVRSEQKSREQSSGTAGAEEETPAGPEYQEGEQGGTRTTQESSSTQSTTNFEIDKEETRISVPQGQVDRLSAAVVVDGNYETGEEGESTFVPKSQEELEQIESLARNAIGFDSERGDSIEVTSMDFGKAEAIPEPGLWDTVLEYAQRFWKPFLNAVIILLFLLLVVRPVVLAIIRPKVSEEEGEEVAGLPGRGESEALESEEELTAKEAKKQFDDLKTQAMEIFDKNREEAMHIVRQWMHEEVKG
ncbi:MAG: flagellar basal-body MS-ring/collar protein FliF [Thermodesulfobacteriota bacterium]